MSAQPHPPHPSGASTNSSTPVSLAAAAQAMQRTVSQQIAVDAYHRMQRQLQQQQQYAQQQQQYAQQHHIQQQQAQHQQQRPEQLTSNFDGVYSDEYDDVMTYALSETGLREMREQMKLVKYHSTRITSSARISSTTNPTNHLSDDLEIYHWRRVDYPSTEYRWSKFDKKLKILSYDDDEYEHLLQDPSWSKNMTDTLIQLCIQYDLRWLVIYDRWQHIYNDVYHQHSLAYTKTLQNQDGDQEVEDNEKSQAAAEQVDGAVVDDVTSSSSSRCAANDDSIIAASPATDPRIVTRPSNTTSTSPAATAAVNASVNDGTSSSHGNTEKEHGDEDLRVATQSSAALQVHASRKQHEGHKHKHPVHHPSTLKSLEELKQRFFNVQRKLLLARNSSDPDIKRHPLFAYEYDAVYESGRKDELLKLYERKPSDAEEIIPYILEHRKLTAEIKRLKRTAKIEKAIRLGKHGFGALSGVSGGGAASVAGMAGQATAAGTKGTQKSQKRKSSIKDITSATGVLSSSTDAAAIVGTQLAEIPHECIPSQDILPSSTALIQSTPTTPPSQPQATSASGVYLRSAQLASTASLNPRLQGILDKQLQALAIKNKQGELQLNVPTGVVADMYDRLRSDIVLLDSLQRHVAEKERLRDANAVYKKQKIR